MTQEVIERSNVECQNCQSPCREMRDSAMGGIYKARTMFKDGTLYFDISDPRAIFPLMHDGEYQVIELKKDIKDVALASLNGNITSAPEGEYHITDISDQTGKNEKSYIVLQRGTWAGELLSAYVAAISEARDRGAVQKAPLDIRLKSASQKKITNLMKSLDSMKIPYFEKEGLGAFIMGKDITEPSVEKDLLGLDAYRVLEHINPRRDTPYLRNEGGVSRPSALEAKAVSGPTNLFRTLNMINTGRSLERKRTKSKNLKL